MLSIDGTTAAPASGRRRSLRLGRWRRRVRGVRLLPKRTTRTARGERVGGVLVGRQRSPTLAGSRRGGTLRAAGLVPLGRRRPPQSRARAEQTGRLVGCVTAANRTISTQTAPRTAVAFFTGTASFDRHSPAKSQLVTFLDGAPVSFSWRRQCVLFNHFSLFV